MERCGHHPGVVAVLVDVQAAAPRGEICKLGKGSQYIDLDLQTLQHAAYHDTNIHRSGKDTGAKTSNSPGSNFGDVNGRNDSGLTDSKTSNESASIDLSQTTVVCQENDDTENPKDAKLSGCPETSNTIGKDEGKKSTTDATDLNHGGDVSLHIGIGLLV